MKEHSREGEQRREMGGALPPPTPLRRGLRPPSNFKRGARASLSVAVDPSLIRKASLPPNSAGVGIPQGLGSRRLSDNGGVRCSRLDGSNAQVQDSGEQPVARYTSRAAEPSRKGERRKAMGGWKTLCLKQRRNEGAFERRRAKKRNGGGAAPPNPPAKGAAPSLDPPLHFKRGARASLSVAVDPSLIRKAKLHTSVSHCSMDSKQGRDD